MLVVRAVENGDVEGLFALAGLAGSGMTTLKPDRAVLAARIEVARASFEARIPANERDYLFVMEDLAASRIVGVCAIKASVGLDTSFYNYRLGILVHSSKELGVFSRMETLTLTNDLTNSAELCTLFLHPDYRVQSNGKWLSKSRFLFIAQFLNLLPERVIAELRGYQDEFGRSPFWDSLGSHFFKMEFDRADDLTSLGQRSFIAELMPRYPFYVTFLPEAAQQAIGRVHVDTAAAKRLLEQEGLCYDGYIDIFDAGPVMQARIKDLRAVRDSTLVRMIDGEQDEERWPTVLVANPNLANFRVIAAHAPIAGRNVMLTQQQQDILQCASGETVRVLSLAPRRKRYA